MHVQGKYMEQVFLYIDSFLFYVFSIAGKGLIIGNIIGIGICLIQKYTGIITLDPQTYYVSEAPVELSLTALLLLNVCTLVVCTLILVVPSFLVSHIHPVKTMKFGE